MTQPNYYELLGVMRNAPPEVIRGAYKALAQKYHPDKNPGDAEAARMTTMLNRAAVTLLNAEKRRVYDEFLNGQAAVSPEPSETPEPEIANPSPPSGAQEETSVPVNWYSGWRLWLTVAVTVVGAKLFSVIGMLSACAVFFWLQPRRGTWFALPAAAVSGVVTAVLLSAFVIPALNGSEGNAPTPRNPASTGQPADMSWLERGSTLVDTDANTTAVAQQSSNTTQHSDYVAAVRAIQGRMASGQLSVIPARATLTSIDGISTAPIRKHALESTQVWWRTSSGLYIYLKNITGLPMTGLEFVYSETSCEIQGERKTFSTNFARALQPDEIAVISVGRDPSFQTPNGSNCLTLTAAKYIADAPIAPTSPNPKPAAARPKEQEQVNNPLRAQAIDNAAEALSRRNAGPYGR